MSGTFQDKRNGTHTIPDNVATAMTIWILSLVEHEEEEHKTFTTDELDFCRSPQHLGTLSHKDDETSFHKGLVWKQSLKNVAGIQ